MKHKGMEKYGKANRNSCVEMGKLIEADIEVRILEFMESAPEHNGKQEEVLEWCKKLETHMRKWEMEMIPNEDIKRMLQSCITRPARRKIILFFPKGLGKINRFLQEI